MNGINIFTFDMKYFWILIAVLVLSGLLWASSTKNDTATEVTDVPVEEETESITPEVRDYFISAEGSYLLGNRSFQVSGVTDLPEGARLSVTIADEDYEEHDDRDIDWRAENLTYISEYTTVRDGKFSVTVTGSELEAPLRSDVYEIEVLFNPRQSSQPNDVITQTGQNGEYLAGEQVDSSISGLKTINFMSLIDITKDTTSMTEWKNPEAESLCIENPNWKAFECEAVAGGAIWIGMSYEMLVEAFGEPTSKNPSNYGSGTQWQWCWQYMNPGCFYDDDDDGRVDSYN